MTKVKFDPATIGKLFEMFNSDSVVKSIDIARGRSQLQPVDVNRSFQNPAAVKSMILPGKRVNAFVVVSAGHVYDDFENNRVKTMDERVVLAKRNAEKLVERLNQILKSSTEPVFRGLEAEIVNKELDISRTYSDPFDDGDDWYGMDIFISIHYKKETT